jgi:hypothetical protein
MGKPSELLCDDKDPRGSVCKDVNSSRRWTYATPLWVLILLSILFLHTVWFACNSFFVRKLTVEERAHKILKENPLIG